MPNFLTVPTWEKKNHQREWANAKRERRYLDKHPYDYAVDEQSPLGCNGPVTHLVKDGKPLTTRGADLLRIMRVILRLTKRVSQRYYEQRGTKVFKRIKTFFCDLFGWGHEESLLDIRNYHLPPALRILHAGVQLTPEQVANYTRLKAAEAIDVPEPVRTLFLVAQGQRPEEPIQQRLPLQAVATVKPVATMPANPGIVPVDVPVREQGKKRPGAGTRAKDADVHKHFADWYSQQTSHVKVMEFFMWFKCVKNYATAGKIDQITIDRALANMDEDRFPPGSSKMYNMTRSVCRMTREGACFIFQQSKHGKQVPTRDCPNPPNVIGNCLYHIPNGPLGETSISVFALYLSKFGLRRRQSGDGGVILTDYEREYLRDQYDIHIPRS